MKQKGMKKYNEYLKENFKKVEEEKEKKQHKRVIVVAVDTQTNNIRSISIQ